MTIQSPLLLGLAALALTACAMALGGPGSPPPAALQGAPGDAPFRCALVTRAGAGGTTIEGRLDAASAVSGTYDLRIRSSGAAIDQGGDFSAGPGQSITLGEAQLGGQTGPIEATLTLSAAGRTTTCPVERP